MIDCASHACGAGVRPKASGLPFRTIAINIETPHRQVAD